MYLKCSSSVYVEGDIETRVYNDSITGEVKNISEICIRRDGAGFFFFFFYRKASHSSKRKTLAFVSATPMCICFLVFVFTILYLHGKLPSCLPCSFVLYLVIEE